MKRLVFSVRDSASEVYSAPFLEVARGAAVRAFADAVNSAPDSGAIAAHPEDFVLYELGSFDDNTGTYECHLPEQIARGQDMRKVRPEGQPS